MMKSFEFVLLFMLRSKSKLKLQRFSSLTTLFELKKLFCFWISETWNFIFPHETFPNQKLVHSFYRLFTIQITFHRSPNSHIKIGLDTYCGRHQRERRHLFWMRHKSQSTVEKTVLASWCKYWLSWCLMLDYHLCAKPYKRMKFTSPKVFVDLCCT